MPKRKRRDGSAIASDGRPPTALERRLCNAICLCQLLSILSGVALIYLCFVVIKPSHHTLEAQFAAEPSVCTTLESKTNVHCERPSCAEWCLSAPSGVCRAINASVRRPGAAVVLRGCELQDEFCSELDAHLLQSFTCSEGEHDGDCHALHGFFNCSQVKATSSVGRGRNTNTSLCRNVTALSECFPTAESRPPGNLTRCNRYVCNDLRGVHECARGVCRRLEAPRCRERCADIAMRNMAVATADRFHWGRCQAAEMDGSRLWSADQAPFAIFCTRLLRTSSPGEFRGEDCVNGTLIPAAEFAALKTYRAVRTALRRHTPRLVPAEQFIVNRTQVMVNIAGCVNTLRGECTEWLAERSVDGSDGRHPAVYPCHVTPLSSEYVITDYSRRQTIRQMVLAATLPCAFLTLSCLSLFLCGKLVAVSEYGVFYCRFCHGEEPGHDRGKSNPL